MRSYNLHFRREKESSNANLNLSCKFRDCVRILIADVDDSADDKHIIDFVYNIGM